MILSELFPAEPSHRHTHILLQTKQQSFCVLIQGQSFLKHFTPTGTEKGVDSIECHF